MRTKYITFGLKRRISGKHDQNWNVIESDILNNFKILGVSAYPLNGEERLQIMYETFNQDSKVPFHFSYDDVLRTGLSTKDYVAPTSFVFKSGKDFEMGGTMELFPIYRSLHRNLPTRCWQSFWRWTAT